MSILSSSSSSPSPPPTTSSRRPAWEVELSTDSSDDEATGRIEAAANFRASLPSGGRSVRSTHSDSLDSMVMDATVRSRPGTVTRRLSFTGQRDFSVPRASTRKVRRRHARSSRSSSLASTSSSNRDEYVAPPTAVSRPRRSSSDWNSDGSSSQRKRKTGVPIPPWSRTARRKQDEGRDNGATLPPPLPGARTPMSESMRQHALAYMERIHARRGVAVAETRRARTFVRKSTKPRLSKPPIDPSIERFIASGSESDSDAASILSAAVSIASASKHPSSHRSSIVSTHSTSSSSSSSSFSSSPLSVVSSRASSTIGSRRDGGNRRLTLEERVARAHAKPVRLPPKKKTKKKGKEKMGKGGGKDGNRVRKGVFLPSPPPKLLTKPQRDAKDEEEEEEEEEEDDSSDWSPPPKDMRPRRVAQKPAYLDSDSSSSSDSSPAKVRRNGVGRKVQKPVFIDSDEDSLSSVEGPRPSQSKKKVTRGTRSRESATKHHVAPKVVLSESSSDSENGVVIPISKRKAPSTINPTPHLQPSRRHVLPSSSSSSSSSSEDDEMEKGRRGKKSGGKQQREEPLPIPPLPSSSESETSSDEDEGSGNRRRGVPPYPGVMQEKKKKPGRKPSVVSISTSTSSSVWSGQIGRTLEKPPPSSLLASESGTEGDVYRVDMGSDVDSIVLAPQPRSPPTPHRRLERKTKESDTSDDSDEQLFAATVQSKRRRRAPPPPSSSASTSSSDDSILGTIGAKKGKRRVRQRGRR